ncbi:MAG: ABC transporter substrate-binding protein, partial [Caldisphaera sp.]
MNQYNRIRSKKLGYIYAVAFTIIIIFSVFAFHHISLLSIKNNVNARIVALKPASPTSLTSVAGQNLSVYIPNYNTNAKSFAVLYAGNGYAVNTSYDYVNLFYKYPGEYLIYYNVYENGVLIGSSSQNLMRIIITPNISYNMSQYLTVPTITFNSTENPSAPLFNVSQKIYLIGSFLQPPSG